MEKKHPISASWLHMHSNESLSFLFIISIYSKSPVRLCTVNTSTIKKLSGRKAGGNSSKVETGLTMNFENIYTMKRKHVILHKTFYEDLPGATV